jgi:hypothetical protein
MMSRTKLMPLTIFGAVRAVGAASRSLVATLTMGAANFRFRDKENDEI